MSRDGRGARRNEPHHPTPSSACALPTSERAPAAPAQSTILARDPQRVRSEAAWAHLCGVAPLEATSGKITRRHRLNRGGNRQANHALWRIVFTRLGSDARTRSYVARRLDDGLSRPEIIRSLKRYVARETYRHLPR
jgi:transposase